VLVVSKLDRLGRNAMDVGSTVAKLAGMGVRVHCLALGGVDLASSTGKLTMNVPGFGGGDASAYRSHAARRGHSPALLCPREPSQEPPTHEALAGMSRRLLMHEGSRRELALT
jgi:hypothetical protein